MDLGYSLGVRDWGSVIFAGPVGPIRILKSHDFAGKNTIFLLSFLFDLLVNFSNFSNVKNSCGIFGREWAGNNYVVPFDFAQIRDCIVAESLALPRGHPPLACLFHTGFLKAANTPSFSMQCESYIEHLSFLGATIIFDFPCLS